MIIFLFLFLLGSKSNFADQRLISQAREKILSTDADFSVSILNAETEKYILEINSKKMLKPASNIKLIVTAAVLKALGTNYQYQTNFYIDKYKNLIIKGSGDPSLLYKQLIELASFLKSKNITRINNIIGINNLFDDQRIGIMWSWSDLTNCYSAQISSLQINQNCALITLKAGEKEKLISINKQIETPYIHIQNTAITKDEKPSQLSIERIRGTNNVNVHGYLNSQTKDIHKWISIHKPEEYFLYLTEKALSEENIEVIGLKHIASDIGYKLDEKLKPIHIIRSKEIKYLLRYFNQHSINLYGESFLKTLGASFFEKGSTYNGRAAINMLLRQYNLNNKEIFIADGSGLSELNLASANYFTGLLEKIYQDSFYRTFKETLSISGLAGTLRNKLNKNGLKGRVFAKTGTLSSVFALSGYLETNSHKTIVFSFIFNNLKNRQNIQNTIKDVLELLVKL